MLLFLQRCWMHVWLQVYTGDGRGSLLKKWSAWLNDWFLSKFHKVSSKDVGGGTMAWDWQRTERELSQRAAVQQRCVCFQDCASRRIFSQMRAFLNGKRVHWFGYLSEKATFRPLPSFLCSVIAYSKAGYWPPWSKTHQLNNSTGLGMQSVCAIRDEI